jgi:hypothetical protein
LTISLSTFLGHLRLVARQLQREEIVARDGQWLAADFVQGARTVLAADAHVACLFAQAAALAGGAGLVADQPRQFLAHGQRVGFLVAAFEIDDDAFESMFAHGHRPRSLR